MLDCENCPHLAVVGLHDTGPWSLTVRPRINTLNRNSAQAPTWLFGWDVAFRCRYKASRAAQSTLIATLLEVSVLLVASDPRRFTVGGAGVFVVSAGVGASWGVLAFKRTRGLPPGDSRDDLLDKQRRHKLLWKTKTQTAPENKRHKPLWKTKTQTALENKDTNRSGKQKTQTALENKDKPLRKTKTQTALENKDTNRSGKQRHKPLWKTKTQTAPENKDTNRSRKQKTQTAPENKDKPLWKTKTQTAPEKKDKPLWKRKRHNPPERLTCHLLSFPPTRHQHQQATRTPVCDQLDPKGHCHWVVKLIFSELLEVVWPEHRVAKVHVYSNKWSQINSKVLASLKTDGG